MEKKFNLKQSYSGEITQFQSQQVTSQQYLQDSNQQQPAQIQISQFDIVKKEVPEVQNRQSWKYQSQISLQESPSPMNINFPLQSPSQISTQISPRHSNIISQQVINQIDDASKYNKKIFLIFKDYNLEFASSKRSFKYCYYDFNIVYDANQFEERSEKYLQMQFNNHLSELKNKLIINPDLKVYLYTKSGDPVNSLIQLPLYQITLILTFSPIFKGITPEVYKEKQYSRLIQLINKLEAPIITNDKQLSQQISLFQSRVNIKSDLPENENENNKQQQASQQNAPAISKLKFFQNKQPKIRQKQFFDKSNMAFEGIIKNKYQKVIQNVIGTLNNFDGASNIQSKDLEQFVKSDNQSLSSKVKSINQLTKNTFQKSKQWEYEGVEQYVNDDDLLIRNKKIEELNQIDEFYEKQLKETKFVKIEPNEDNKGQQDKYKLFKANQPVQVTSNIYQIGLRLGIFHKKVDMAFGKQIVTNKSDEQQSDGTTREKQKQEIKMGYNEKVNKYDLQALENLDELLKKIEEKNCAKCNKPSKLKQKTYNRLQILEKIAKTLNILIEDFQKEVKLNIKKTFSLQKNKITQFISNNNNQESICDLSKSISVIKDNQNEDAEKIDVQQVQQDLVDILTGEKDDFDHNQKYLGDIQIDFEESEDETTNFQKQNKFAILNRKTVIRQIGEQNQELSLKNIPEMLLKIPNLLQKKKKKESNFTRFDMHNIYSIYKTLHETTSQRYPLQQYNIEDGVDYQTYRNGLYQVFMQSEELAKRIFNTIDYNYSGFMDWEEFLKLMVSIRAKTLNEKINLFIKIADLDGNGMLSWDEIYDLARICLSRYITENGEEDTFLNDLCHYFTRLIFSAVGIDIESEIPLSLIKKVIKSGHQDSNLLCMFCGADI